MTTAEIIAWTVYGALCLWAIWMLGVNAERKARARRKRIDATRMQVITEILSEHKSDSWFNPGA